jgi:hypothetical protein
VFGCVVDTVEYRDRTLQISAARVSEIHLARTPDQQDHAEFAFKLADLLRQRRLRYVDALGRPPEVQLFGYCPKVPEMAQLDH